MRSPDGKQLLCLLRENSRKLGGLFMTSDDEGRTWSDAKPLPPGLHGDRHKAHFSNDGRLVVCFRDTGKLSPTRNHFVAWVGRYEDIVAGCDGQYKIKLLNSNAGSDCGYPGLEMLPDGTFVATTYIKYHPDTEKQSVVSTHFKLEETGTGCRAKKSGRAPDPPTGRWQTGSRRRAIDGRRGSPVRQPRSIFLPASESPRHQQRHSPGRMPKTKRPRGRFRPVGSRFAPQSRWGQDVCAGADALRTQR